MGLFDFSSDTSNPSPGYGVLAADVPVANSEPFMFQIPYVNRPTTPYSLDVPSIFPSPSFVPDGGQLIDQRTNTSFWNYDQSKVSQSLQNVFGSLVEAGAKTGIQVAQSTINRGTQQQGQIGGFFRNFQSTQTGAQINAAGYATQIQNFLFSPIVWFASIALVIGYVFLRRG